MRLPDEFSNEANGTAHSPEHGPNQGQARGPAPCGITTAPPESRSESAAQHDVRGTSTTTTHTTKNLGPSAAVHDARIVIKTGLAESMSPFTTLSPFTTPTDGRCLDCRMGDGQVSCLECFANTAPALDNDTKSTTTTVTIPSDTTTSTTVPSSITDPSTTTATVTSPTTTTSISTSATTITPSTQTVTKIRTSTETVTASHAEPTWTTIVTSPTTTTTTTTTTLASAAASIESAPLRKFPFRRATRHKMITKKKKTC